MNSPAGTAERQALPAAVVCCTPLLGEPVTAGQAAGLARTLKALADPVRLRLVSMVAARENGEACVCELTEPLGLTQPTISHHLKILVDAGILTRDKRGVRAYYALVPATLHALAVALTPSPGPRPRRAPPARRPRSRRATPAPARVTMGECASSSSAGPGSSAAR